MKKLIVAAFAALTLAAPAASVSAAAMYSQLADHCTGPTGQSAHWLMLSRGAVPFPVGTTVHAFGDTCTATGSIIVFPGGR